MRGVNKKIQLFSSTKWSSFPIRSFAVFPNYDFFPASFDHLRNICASGLFVTKSITLPSLSFRRCETTQYIKLKLVLCEVYQLQNEVCRAWLLQCASFFSTAYTTICSNRLETQICQCLGNPVNFTSKGIGKECKKNDHLYDKRFVIFPLNIPIHFLRRHIPKMFAIGNFSNNVHLPNRSFTKISVIWHRIWKFSRNLPHNFAWNIRDSSKIFRQRASHACYGLYGGTDMSDSWHWVICLPRFLKAIYVSWIWRDPIHS